MCACVTQFSIYCYFCSVFAQVLVHSQKLSAITYCLIMPPIATIAYAIIGNHEKPNHWIMQF